jgi:3-methyladenine DNA glycosylase/8-oxoguanine DNA glycosylase
MKEDIVETSFANIVTTATAYLSDVDPVMKTTIERVGSCTLQPNPDIFEALVDAIISQQISVQAANAIMARVRAALPDSKVTVETLQLLDFDRLRTLGLSTPKARYVGNLVGANLMGANLRDADLMYANLMGANLKDADLNSVHLGGANLRECLVLVVMRLLNLQPNTLSETSQELATLYQSRS